MARKTGIPAYRKHRQSGQAIVTLPDPSGRRRDFLLGTYGTKESKCEYTRLLNEWEENHRRIPGATPRSDLTINELILTFWTHVERHYRHPDGTPTSEVHNFRASLKPLRELYGHTLASNFGPLALKAVRKTMIDAGLVRSVINKRVSRIRLMFRWAAGEEIIQPIVFHALKAVDGLQAGRSEAKDNPRIQPVDEEAVEQTLPHLNRHLQAMVQVQRLTGMRPGEVCVLRRSEIDMSGQVWMFRPVQHKNSWRGTDRAIGIGPKAQEILKEFFTFAMDACPLL